MADSRDFRRGSVISPLSGNRRPSVPIKQQRVPTASSLRNGHNTQEIRDFVIGLIDESTHSQVVDIPELTNFKNNLSSRVNSSTKRNMSYSSADSLRFAKFLIGQLETPEGYQSLLGGIASGITAIFQPLIKKREESVLEEIKSSAKSSSNPYAKIIHFFLIISGLSTKPETKAALEIACRNIGYYNTLGGKAVHDKDPFTKVFTSTPDSKLQKIFDSILECEPFSRLKFNVSHQSRSEINGMLVDLLKEALPLLSLDLDLSCVSKAVVLSPSLDVVNKKTKPLVLAVVSDQVKASLKEMLAQQPAVRTSTQSLTVQSSLKQSGKNLYRSASVQLSPSDLLLSRQIAESKYILHMFDDYVSDLPEEQHEMIAAFHMIRTTFLDEIKRSLSSCRNVSEISKQIEANNKRFLDAMEKQFSAIDLEVKLSEKYDFKERVNILFKLFKRATERGNVGRKIDMIPVKIRRNENGDYEIIDFARRKHPDKGRERPKKAETSTANFYRRAADNSIDKPSVLFLSKPPGSGKTFSLPRSQYSIICCNDSSSVNIVEEIIKLLQEGRNVFIDEWDLLSREDINKIFQEAKNREKGAVILASASPRLLTSLNLTSSIASGLKVPQIVNTKITSCNSVTNKFLEAQSDLVNKFDQGVENGTLLDEVKKLAEEVNQQCFDLFECIKTECKGNDSLISAAEASFIAAKNCCTNPDYDSFVTGDSKDIIDPKWNDTNEDNDLEVAVKFLFNEKKEGKMDDKCGLIYYDPGDGITDIRSTLDKIVKKLEGSESITFLTQIKGERKAYLLSPNNVEEDTNIGWGSTKHVVIITDKKRLDTEKREMKYVISTESCCDYCKMQSKHRNRTNTGPCEIWYTTQGAKKSACETLSEVIGRPINKGLKSCCLFGQNAKLPNSIVEELKDTKFVNFQKNFIFPEDCTFSKTDESKCNKLLIEMGRVFSNNLDTDLVNIFYQQVTELANSEDTKLPMLKHLSSVILKVVNFVEEMKSKYTEIDHSYGSEIFNALDLGYKSAVCDLKSLDENKASENLRKLVQKGLSHIDSVKETADVIEADSKAADRKRRSDAIMKKIDNIDNRIKKIKTEIETNSDIIAKTKEKDTKDEKDDQKIEKYEKKNEKLYDEVKMLEAKLHILDSLDIDAMEKQFALWDVESKDNLETSNETVNIFETKPPVEGAYVEKPKTKFTQPVKIVITHQATDVPEETKEEEQAIVNKRTWVDAETEKKDVLKQPYNYSHLKYKTRPLDSLKDKRNEERRLAIDTLRMMECEGSAYDDNSLLSTAKLGDKRIFSRYYTRKDSVDHSSSNKSKVAAETKHRTQSPIGYTGSKKM